MKIAIIGGGISGLSTAYYLKKLTPASLNLNVSIFEASSRWGGWINSKKVTIGNDTVYFEKGPRTLRLSTGEEKELNSIQYAKDLKLDSSIETISNKHPAATNRYIYFNNRIHKVQPKLFSKSEIFGQPLIKIIWKEYKAPIRDAKIEDESIWSFVSRRFGNTMADNIVDPVFKGICGGDVKYLSAKSLLKSFYQYEIDHGSVIKGVLTSARKKGSQKNQITHKDLDDLRNEHINKSVWRLKYGLEEIIQRTLENLKSANDHNSNVNFNLYLNEPIESLEFNESDSKPVKLKSKTINDDFDLVISSVLSKSNYELIILFECSYELNLLKIQDNSSFLSDKYANLKNLLNQISSVNIVLVNFYFDKNVLPVKGFGYLVPTNQNSSILGCIFDSIFNSSSQQNTVLTVMMGGAWYDQLPKKDSNSLVQLAYDELKNHLKLTVEPKYHEISILKDAIPQYKVGHESLLVKIKDSIKNENLNNKLFLTGNSYEGVGVNDCIYNSRKLVENILFNKLNAK